MSWNTVNLDNYMTTDEIDQWISDKRRKVMYKDAKEID